MDAFDNTSARLRRPAPRLESKLAARAIVPNAESGEHIEGFEVLAALPPRSGRQVNTFPDISSQSGQYKYYLDTDYSLFTFYMIKIIYAGLRWFGK